LVRIGEESLRSEAKYHWRIWMNKDSEKDVSLEWTPRFGSVAVDMGFATSEQVKDAMDEQVDDNIRNKPHRPLGKILFEKDWMSHQEIEMVLNELFKRKRVPNPLRPF
jgi:hypothetical protein